MLRFHRNIVAAAGILLLAASGVSAQERRAAGPGGPPGANRPVVPRNSLYPFMGTWTGAMQLDAHTEPLIFEFVFLNGSYSGATVWPNAVAPHAATRLIDSDLHWEMKNSGGGTWIYHARRPARDTLSGTVELRGAAEPVKGTFTLVRKLPPVEIPR